MYESTSLVMVGAMCHLPLHERR